MTDHVECSVCVSVERDCPTLPPHGFPGFPGFEVRFPLVLSGLGERMYPWSAAGGIFSSASLGGGGSIHSVLVPLLPHLPY